MARRKIYRGPRPRSQQTAIGKHANGRLFFQIVQAVCERILNTPPSTLTTPDGRFASRIVLARDEDGMIWFCDGHFGIKVPEDLLIQAAKQSSQTQEALFLLPEDPHQVVELQGGKRIREGKEVSFFNLFKDAQELIDKGTYSRLYPSPYLLYAPTTPVYVQEYLSIVLQFDPVNKNLTTKFNDNLYLQIDFAQVIQTEYWELEYFTETPKKGTKKQSLPWCRRTVYIQKDKEIVGVAMPIHHGSPGEIYSQRYQNLSLGDGNERGSHMHL